jgi:hypothetical protein
MVGKAICPDLRSRRGTGIQQKLSEFASPPFARSNQHLIDMEQIGQGGDADS